MFCIGLVLIPIQMFWMFVDDDESDFVRWNTTLVFMYPTLIFFCFNDDIKPREEMVKMEKEEDFCAGLFFKFCEFFAVLAWPFLLIFLIGYAIALFFRSIRRLQKSVVKLYQKTEEHINNGEIHNDR